MKITDYTVEKKEYVFAFVNRALGRVSLLIDNYIWLRNIVVIEDANKSPVWMLPSEMHSPCSEFDIEPNESFEFKNESDEQKLCEELNEIVAREFGGGND